MQHVIREGALRLLATESSCDVIISCLGFKLVAHKIILSIASPVLQNLLEENCTQQPTMLIFPDVAGTTMSLILDYIYTGHVTLFLGQIPEFLGLVRLLRIKLEDECDQLLVSAMEKQRVPKMEALKKEPEIKMKKLVPDLIPITRSNRVRERRTRGLFNKVIPSPWTPRAKEVMVDPRSDRLFTCNDSNNNIESSAIALQTPLNFPHLQQLKTSTIVSTSQEYSYFTEKSETLPEILKERDKLLDVPIATSPLKEKLCESEDNSSPSLNFGDNNKDSDVQVLVSSKPDDPDVDKGEANDESDKNKKDKPFKCDDCGKQFSQLRNYKYHRSIHDGTKEFSTRCPECGKMFNDKGYLSSHMKIHRDRKEYACQHCPKRFNQRVAYNMHLRIHTGVKPHECNVCGKSFSRKMLLKQHQRVHTGERPYTCAECGKSFADRSNMSLHARLHTGVKPYSCTVCPKSFTKKHHLKTHMNFHTGLKPYSCEKCGLSFSQSSNMRTHYKKCILKVTNSNNINNNKDKSNNGGESDNVAGGVS